MIDETWEVSGKGMKVLNRTDTDETIEQEPMDPEDFQLEFPMEESKKKKAA